MKRLAFTLSAVAALVAAVTAATAQGTVGTIAIQRDPSCTCCLKWVAHLEQAGFETTISESADMAAIKTAAGVPSSAQSCHTGTINGYVIEGHVPADDIKRLLRERPDVRGLAVPGMPAGSPGMEAASGRVTPYDVLAFDKAGTVTVFASHR